ncbi:Uip5p, partial [Ascoidea rubescens DSM 1968]
FGSNSINSFSNEELNSILGGHSRNLKIIKKIENPKFNLKSPYLKNDLSGETSPNWNFNGDILIRNNKYVRLTSEQKHQSSRVFSNSKINETSFELEFYLSINGKGMVNGLHGDGMAIFLSTEQLGKGPVMGAQENFNGLSIIVDTYKNGRAGVFPYVQAWLNDGTQSYDKDNDGKANEITGCVGRSLWNPKQGVVKARLFYVQDGYISLDFDYRNDENWKNCFTLQDIFLPKDFYLGFSAQTGDLYQNVDLVETHLYSLYKFNDEPIDEFNDLLQIMSDPDPNSPDKFEDAIEEVIIDRNTRRSRKISKRRDSRQQKRTLRRLQASERRIKKEAELRKLQRKQKIKSFFKFVKNILLFIIASFILYVVYVYIKVQMRNKKRQYKNVGLL